jgi:hypothetical protein
MELALLGRRGCRRFRVRRRMIPCLDLRFGGAGGPQPAPTAWDGLSSKDRLISSCRTVTKELSGKDFRDGSSHAQGLRRLYGFRFVRWRTGQTAQG